MLSVIVAVTLVMLAAVWVGDAFSFSGVSVYASGGTVDFSSELAMLLDSTAECAESRRGLKTVSKLCVPPRPPR
jgi:hypothetical protein